MQADSQWFEKSAPPGHHFKFYLPSQQLDGRPVENFDEISRITSELLCELFGGATSYAAKGVFKKSAGDSQEEDIAVVESFCDDDKWNLHSSLLEATASILAGALHQETIACSLDGKMAFVDGGAKPIQTPVPFTMQSLRSQVEDCLRGEDNGSPPRCSKDLPP